VTNAGETTWAGFAREIFARAGALGLKTARVKPIATAEYPTPAARPAYSVLDNGKVARVFGVRLPPWQDALGRCLAGLDPIG
jgi:dTDP-4-dehydrorhamnose reductase